MQPALILRIFFHFHLSTIVAKISLISQAVEPLRFLLNYFLFSQISKRQASLDCQKVHEILKMSSWLNPFLLIAAWQKFILAFI